jgi:transcriptional regulator with XRE-family HTH domain
MSTSYPPLLAREMARIREVVRSRDLSLIQVSRESGIPFGTLKRVYYGDTLDPRVSVLQKLHDYLEGAH